MNGQSIEFISKSINLLKNHKFNEISTLTDNLLVTTYHDEYKNYDFSNKKVLVIGNN